jgi:hypothetical protein
VTPPLPTDPEAARLELAEGEELTVFRIVRIGDVEDPAFVDSFRSHAELGLPPRGPEAVHEVIYEGVSVFETREAATETARKWPQIGQYVAELRLTHETGVLYLRWGPSGHLTLWADALTLTGTAVDTMPVEGDA